MIFYVVLVNVWLQDNAGHGEGQGQQKRPLPITSGGLFI
jgi:hypothetical protein